MRLILSAAALALALSGLTASAAPTPEAGYNQWWCQASVYSYGHAHYFSGWSAEFPQGSGQGQQAHQTAYQYALSHCEDYGNYYGVQCSCDFQNDCWVEQH